MVAIMIVAIMTVFTMVLTIVMNGHDKGDSDSPCYDYNHGWHLTGKMGSNTGVIMVIMIAVYSSKMIIVTLLCTA